MATFAIALIGALASLVSHESLYRALGASADLFPLMSEYFLIIVWVMVVQLVTMVLYYFIRVDGFPVLATTALVVGSGANILLDALLVGYLDYGLRGAAVATGIAQILQFGVLLFYISAWKRRLKFQLHQQQWNEVFKAFTNGVSEWINEVSVGVVMLLINLSLIHI